MTRKFARNSIEDAFQSLEDLRRRVDAIQNNNETTLPFRDRFNLPPGVEGQVVIGDYFILPDPESGNFNDGVINATWTNLGGTGGTLTHVSSSTTNGTTPGYWGLSGDGTGFFNNQIAGTWRVDIAGTLTHTGTTATTIMKIDNGGSTAWDTIHNSSMASGASHTIAYSNSFHFNLSDMVRFAYSHAISSGSPSSHFVGTVIFTLIGL